MTKLTKNCLLCGIALCTALTLGGCASNQAQETPAQKKANTELTEYNKNANHGFVKKAKINPAHNTYDVTFRPAVNKTLQYWKQQIAYLQNVNSKYKHNQKALQQQGNKLDNNYLKMWNKKSIRQQKNAIANTASVGVMDEEIQHVAKQAKDKHLTLDIANLPRNNALNKALKESGHESYNQMIDKRKDLSKQQKQQLKNIHKQEQSNQQNQKKQKIGAPNSKGTKNTQKEIDKGSWELAKLSKDLLNPKKQKQMERQMSQSLKQMSQNKKPQQK